MFQTAADPTTNLHQPAVTPLPTKHSERDRVVGNKLRPAPLAVVRFLCPGALYIYIYILQHSNLLDNDPTTVLSKKKLFGVHAQVSYIYIYIYIISVSVLAQAVPIVAVHC